MSDLYLRPGGIMPNWGGYTHPVGSPGSEGGFERLPLIFIVPRGPGGFEDIFRRTPGPVAGPVNPGSTPAPKNGNPQAHGSIEELFRQFLKYLQQRGVQLPGQVTTPRTTPRTAPGTTPGTGPVPGTGSQIATIGDGSHGNTIIQNGGGYSSPIRGADGKLSRPGVDEAIRKWSDILGIDPKAALALQRTENAGLLDQSQVCDAQGAMQVRPETQQRMLEELRRQGLDTSRLSPDEQNMVAGLYYFKKCLEKAGGDPALAQHYYQYGLGTRNNTPEQGRLDRFRQHYGAAPSIGSGTENQNVIVNGNGNIVNQNPTIINGDNNIEALLRQLLEQQGTCQADPGVAPTLPSMPPVPEPGLLPEAEYKRLYEDPKAAEESFLLDLAQREFFKNVERFPGLANLSPEDKNIYLQGLIDEIENPKDTTPDPSWGR